MVSGGLRLRANDWQSLVSHLERCLPEEGCGLLAGAGEQIERVLPVENELHSRVRYRMEPRGLVAALNQIDAAGMEMLGAFHSHPAGPDGVSPSDVAEWGYPEAALVVCALDGDRWHLRAYRVEDDRAREIPLVVEDH